MCHFWVGQSPTFGLFSGSFSKSISCLTFGLQCFCCVQNLRFFPVPLFCAGFEISPNFLLCAKLLRFFQFHFCVQVAEQWRVKSNLLPQFQRFISCLLRNIISDRNRAGTTMGLKWAITSFHSYPSHNKRGKIAKEVWENLIKWKSFQYSINNYS